MNIIVCDGSCLRNPGPGGWAYAFIQGSKVEYYSGSAPQTTNNIMELTSMLEALKHGHADEIYTDSTYVANGMNVWVKGWKKSGWKTSQNKIVKNLEIWQEIDRLYNGKIQIKWIKGHASPDDYETEQEKFLIEIQNKVDHLARKSALSLK